MVPLRVQFFLCYSVIGALMPYLPVYLSEHKGLNDFQVGMVVGSSGVAVFLTPVVITFLADRRVDSRLLIAGLFILHMIALFLLEWVTPFTAVLGMFALSFLAVAPMMPLQDGLYFTVQEQHIRRNERVSPYHRVRLWGTIGFIVPSILLYVLLVQDYSLAMVIYVTAAFCVFGIFNAFFLPDVRNDVVTSSVYSEKQMQSESVRNCSASDDKSTEMQHAAESRDKAELPTLAAARACLEPHVFVFSVAMLLAMMAAMAFYGFYPVYLREIIGIEEQWIGIISSVGVCVEIIFILAFGWMVNRFGLRWVMAVGMIGFALRMALLWLWPVAIIAIGTQIFHGLMVLVVHVAPPIFLNHHAEDRFRNSMQGFFTMAVLGVGRLAGGLVAGAAAHRDLMHVFALGTGLCVAAGLLFIFAFNERDKPLKIPA